MELGDPTELAAALIRRPSVTPRDEGALDVLIHALRSLGFECHDLTFQSEGEPPIRNLYARRGAEGPNLCFAGHTDVVPAGNGWTEEPFAASIRDGRLFGRGAVDMKGAIAAFVSAVALAGELPGSVSLLITGDEEGEAIDGTLRLLEWLDERNETLHACLVGEPTNPRRLGEMIKVGRRGSLNATLTVYGVQGHVAYPDRAENPIPKMMQALASLRDELDTGFARFQPSNLEVTSIDVGNRTTNLIPGQAQAAFNVRFNPNWTGASLEAELRKRLDATGVNYALQCRVSGEAFLTEDVPWVSSLAQHVELHTGVAPELSTSGGTSDARFIRSACPVVEFGLVGQTMHKADEHVELESLRTLTAIYRDFIRDYFATA
ncbi:MAG: succinyl-diaminopimelate desuccinylase [Myxococcota bacterium]